VVKAVACLSCSWIKMHSATVLGQLLMHALPESMLDNPCVTSVGKRPVARYKAVGPDPQEHQAAREVPREMEVAQ
jgi:hypothetical protein